eukprot:8749688-Alexandrium_andersonii.AAC.1
MLALVDSWGVLLGRELLATAAWPVVAEFCLGQDGEAYLACLHAPVEQWSGEVAAVVTGHVGTESARTEPVFFATAGDQNTHKQE